MREPPAARKPQTYVGIVSAFQKLSVGEIVAANPAAAEVFDIVGIDYACHGSLTLRDACAEAGLDPTDVRRSLENLPQPVGVENWLEVPLPRLIDHLREKQHPRLAHAAMHASAVVGDRCGPCADHPDEMERIQRVVRGLARMWQAHAAREEHILFPVLAHLDECWARGERPALEVAGGTPSAIAAALEEHAGLNDAIRELQSVTLKLAALEPSCPRLQRAIFELEHALREHLHLENNILYPRAAALREAVTKPEESRAKS